MSRLRSEPIPGMLMTVDKKKVIVDHRHITVDNTREG